MGSNGTDGRALGIRQQLEESYASKPAQLFVQIDGFANVEPGDEIITPNEHGDCIFYGATVELRTTGLPMRVQIHESASRQDVIRLLEQALEAVENDWGKLQTLLDDRRSREGQPSLDEINHAKDEVVPF